MDSPIRLGKIWDVDRNRMNIPIGVMSGMLLPCYACRDPECKVSCIFRSFLQCSVNWVVKTDVCCIQLFLNCPGSSRMAERVWKKLCGRKEATEAQFNCHESLQEFFHWLNGSLIKLLVRGHVQKNSRPPLLFHICSGSAEFIRSKNLAYSIWKIEGVKVMRNPQLIDVGVEKSCKMNCFKYTKNITPKSPQSLPAFIVTDFISFTALLFNQQTS